MLNLYCEMIGKDTMNDAWINDDWGEEYADTKIDI